MPAARCYRGRGPSGIVGRVSLFWRIFLLNAAVLVAATACCCSGPVTVSTPVLLTEALVLGAGLVAMLVANAVLLRVGLAPLDRLTRAMATIDLLQPGTAAGRDRHAAIADLIRTFNTMLDRLEAERATSTARALSAQEAERRRIAQELHDEVGQTLTAVLLELKRVADHAPPPVRDELHQVQETTRGSLDEIRRIARRLRPGVLEELGLAQRAAVAGHRVRGRGGLTVRHELGDRPAAAGPRGRARALPRRPGGPDQHRPARRRHAGPRPDAASATATRRRAAGRATTAGDCAARPRAPASGACANARCWSARDLRRRPRTGRRHRGATRRARLTDAGTEDA